MRDPLSTWPALLPVIEMTEPTPMSSAPADAQKHGRRVGNRRAWPATFGSTPCATICVSVMTIITDRIVATIANGTCAPRIERLARRHRHHFVAAVDEDQQQRRRRALRRR